MAFGRPVPLHILPRSLWERSDRDWSPIFTSSQQDPVVMGGDQMPSLEAQLILLRYTAQKNPVLTFLLM